MHDLVIFDCDGVLVDSEVISNEVLARMLTQEGLPTTLSEARRACQGLLLTDVRDQAQAKLGRPFPLDWVAEYEHERDEAFRRELNPVEGAAEAVQASQDSRTEGLRCVSGPVGEDTIDARADRACVTCSRPTRCSLLTTCRAPSRTPRSFNTRPPQ